MDFDIPADLAAYVAELDAFIDAEIRPLEQQDDNVRFFDHRREDARTDCCARPAAARTRRATTGTRSPLSTAGGTAPTSGWR
jgi:hypothetical protein